MSINVKSCTAELDHHQDDDDDEAAIDVPELMVDFVYQGHTYKVAKPRKAQGRSGFICSIRACRKAFKEQCHAKSHYVRTHISWHPDQYTKVCELLTCGKKYKNSSELKRHYKKTNHHPVEFQKATPKATESSARATRSGVLQ